MTIAEAAKKWKVREKTVWNYIEKGYIYDLSLKNNEIILPDIPKPYTQHNARNVNSIYNAILYACNNKLYLNADILKIDKQDFITYIFELEKTGYIARKNQNINDMETTLNYIPTKKGTDAAEKQNNTFNISLIQNAKFSLANF